MGEARCTSCEELIPSAPEGAGEGLLLCDDCISQAMEGVGLLYTCAACGMQMEVTFPEGYFDDVEEARQLYLAAVNSHREGWCKKT